MVELKKFVRREGREKEMEGVIWNYEVGMIGIGTTMESSRGR